LSDHLVGDLLTVEFGGRFIKHCNLFRSCSAICLLCIVLLLLSSKRGFFCCFYCYLSYAVCRRGRL